MVSEWVLEAAIEDARCAQKERQSNRRDERADTKKKALVVKLGG